MEWSCERARTWQRMTASWLGPFLPFCEKREATFRPWPSPSGPPPPPCSSITYTTFSSESSSCCTRFDDAQIPMATDRPTDPPLPSPLPSFALPWREIEQQSNGSCGGGRWQRQAADALNQAQRWRAANRGERGIRAGVGGWKWGQGWSALSRTRMRRGFLNKQIAQNSGWIPR